MSPNVDPIAAKHPINNGLYKVPAKKVARGAAGEKIATLPKKVIMNIPAYPYFLNFLTSFTHKIPTIVITIDNIPAPILIIVSVSIY